MWTHFFDNFGLCYVNTRRISILLTGLDVLFVGLIIIINILSLFGINDDRITIGISDNCKQL